MKLDSAGVVGSPVQSYFPYMKTHSWVPNLLYHDLKFIVVCPAEQNIFFIMTQFWQITECIVSKKEKKLL